MYPVKNDKGETLGFIWRGSSCWIAGPHGSQIQNIPCDSVVEAAKIVKRMGKVSLHPFVDVSA